MISLKTTTASARKRAAAPWKTTRIAERNSSLFIRGICMRSVGTPPKAAPVGPARTLGSGRIVSDSAGKCQPNPSGGAVELVAVELVALRRVAPRGAARRRPGLVVSVRSARTGLSQRDKHGRTSLYFRVRSGHGLTPHTCPLPFEGRGNTTSDAHKANVACRVRR